MHCIILNGRVIREPIDDVIQWRRYVGTDSLAADVNTGNVAIVIVQAKATHVAGAGSWEWFGPDLDARSYSNPGPFDRIVTDFSALREGQGDAIIQPPIPPEESDRITFNEVVCGELVVGH